MIYDLPMILLKLLGCSNKLRKLNTLKFQKSFWALAWCLNHPAVTPVIPGYKNPEQVILNAKAVDLVIDNHPQAVEI